MSPSASVIIPSHNRAETLLFNLQQLAAQDFPANNFEVIVVLDGCSDDSAARLAQMQPPYALSVLEQPAGGPAAARNAGAARARGDVLIFLDDDIQAWPGLVSAHVRSHRRDDQVSVGYLPPMLNEQGGLFRQELRAWWEAMFQAMREPGHRFAYTDLLSGNFSLRAVFFRRVGGFDERLTCHEDYELGYRLLAAGGQFQFVEQAAGFHHERSSLERALARKTEEGVADVLLGQQYPELRPALLMSRLIEYALPASRLFCWLAFHTPRLGDGLMNFFLRSLGTLERLRFDALWRRVLYGLLGYWYWRGVRTRLPRWKDVRAFLQSVPAAPPVDLTLDLREGLGSAQQLLDQLRPEAINLAYAGTLVGVVEPRPGCEALRGVHLMAILSTTALAVPLMQALAFHSDELPAALREKLLADLLEML